MIFLSQLQLKPLCCIGLLLFLCSGYITAASGYAKQSVMSTDDWVNRPIDDELQAASALKVACDTHWDNKIVTIEQIERCIHEKYADDILLKLYGRKQFFAFIEGGMHAISYSFMVEAPRRRGTAISEYLVAFNLKRCFKAHSVVAKVLKVFANQAIEDTCVPYLSYIINLPEFPSGCLDELHIAAKKIGDDALAKCILEKMSSEGY